MTTFKVDEVGNITIVSWSELYKTLVNKKSKNNKGY